MHVVLRTQEYICFASSALKKHLFNDTKITMQIFQLKCLFLFLLLTILMIPFVVQTEELNYLFASINLAPGTSPGNK